MKMWLVLGFFAQALFTTRFLVQWIASEKQKQSVIPIYFWYLSLAGGTLLLVYAIHIKDPVFIAGQSVGVFIYARNLMLIYKQKKKTSKGKSFQTSQKDIPEK
jgi:lipid-A-disaccharide synthase-like uncharacterized protein